MSEIQRYDFERVTENDCAIVECLDGQYVKLDDHAAIVAQLETELAEALKDQERYRLVRDMTPEDFGNLSTINEDFDSQVDAMIKGQQ